jgi:hypothetical protein
VRCKGAAAPSTEAGLQPLLLLSNLQVQLEPVPLSLEVLELLLQVLHLQGTTANTCCT